MSKILYQWILLLNPLCFLWNIIFTFTTRVFGHSAITPFLGDLGLDAETCGILSTIEAPRLLQSKRHTNMSKETCIYVHKDQFVFQKRHLRLERHTHVSKETCIYIHKDQFVFQKRHLRLDAEVCRLLSTTALLKPLDSWSQRDTHICQERRL